MGGPTRKVKTITTTVDLIRVEESAQGTFGVLLIRGEVFCVTLEPPDLDNLKGKSSIPEAIYTALRVSSPKYGDTFEVVNVPGRSHILFHAGNVMDHTKGCIILGQHYGKLRGNRAVLNSGKTFHEFLCQLADENAFIFRTSNLPKHLLAECKYFPFDL